MSKPHVCFVAAHIYPVLVPASGLGFVGGAEVQQAVQMRALQRAGYRISVLTKDEGQPEVVDCEGIAIHRVPSDAGRGLPGTRFLYPRMTDVVAALRRIDPDVVFVQTASEQVAAAALYARLAGKRLVFAGASDPDFARGALPGLSRWHATLYRLGLRAADAILVQNQFQREALARNFGRLGRLVQNGYAEAGAIPGAFEGHVLWAATVKPLKRPELFIELARSLPARRFVMVGGPGLTPDARAFHAVVQRSAADVPNLEFVGHVPFDRVGRWFDGAALVVNTSDYEGLPNTFMQAWIRGIPTLSFVRPESSPGVTGTIACSGLSDMIARARTLTTDAAAWARASRACREHFAAHHTMERATEHYAEVFAPAGQA
ncbi:MAG TPA: glycosyltransferase family 4 protein [Burkholderiaceae bacterium]